MAMLRTGDDREHQRIWPDGSAQAHQHPVQALRLYREHDDIRIAGSLGVIAAHVDAYFS